MKWKLLVPFVAICVMPTALWAADGKKEDKKEKAKDTVVNGELIQADLKDKVRTQSYSKTYTYKMIEGRNYQIDMTSNDFDSYLRLEDPAGQQVAEDDDSGGFPHARIVYKASKTGDFTIVTTTFGGGSTGKFMLVVKDLTGGPVPKEEKKEAPKDVKDGKGEPKAKAGAKAIDLKLGKDQTASHSGSIANDDPQYQGRKLSKTFVVPMEAGKTYRIDLSSKAFDAYLYLEDPNGKVVDQNDDNGESLDSRIIHKAEKAGNYRIVATSLGGKDTGAFTLSIRLATEDDAKQAALRQRVNKIFAASAEERKETVREVVKHLEAKGKKIGQAEVQMALGVTQALEFAKDEKVAAEACSQFAKLFAKADDTKVADLAKMLEGVGRRLGLVGNEMEVKGKLLDGKDFDLKDFKGKVVLVDFWATWCGPCVAEIPHMKKMHAKYNKQGFEIIGISLDNTEDALKKFIAKEELPWGSIYDTANRGSGLADRYGVMSIPLPILIGRDGRVVSMNARGEELTRLLEKMMTEK